MEKVITVSISKPLYGNMCYINETVIDKAIRYGFQLEVKTPTKTKVVDPKEWKQKGQRMSKIFKRPDQPMILFGANLDSWGVEVEQSPQLQLI